MLVRLIIAAIALLLSVQVAPLRAAQQDTRAQLEQIRQRIESAQSDLAAKKQSEVKLSRELVLLRQTLKRIDRRIAVLRKQQRGLQRQLDQQLLDIQNGKHSIRVAGKRLQKRLVALYKEGEIGPLKILFSADSPTELVRQFQYLTRILHFDKELLAKYKLALTAQQDRLAKLENLQRQQQRLLVTEQEQRKDAKRGRQLQARLLKQVKRDKAKLKSELTELQAKAKRLQGLVTELKQQPQEKLVVGSTSFSAGKGRLSWPVNGKVLIGYGTKKDPQIGTLYESNGFEISTSKNEPIRAVAAGRVVFADWFKGYGNLLILSHPGGYHTLYAQADKLLHAIGDQLKAGDLLGYSGLRGRDSIYFEIRYKGTPIDPNKWLKRRR